MQEQSIFLVIALTFFGFIALAFILLYPVYRFLRREERASEQWTPGAIAKRQQRDEPSGDGPSSNPASPFTNPPSTDQKRRKG